MAADFKYFAKLNMSLILVWLPISKTSNCSSLSNSLQTLYRSGSLDRPFKEYSGFNNGRFGMYFPISGSNYQHQSCHEEE
jgi:hypothetical protein